MTSSSSSNIDYYNYDLPINSVSNMLQKSIHYIDKKSYDIINDSNSIIKNFQISFSYVSSRGNNKSFLSQIESIVRRKIIKKYNCTNEKYNFYIINNILRNDYCHIVSRFKDILINSPDVEYFYKYHKKVENEDLLKKLYLFYKNYFNFYCKPIFSNISLSLFFKSYFDKKAKCFLNLEYSSETSKLEDIKSKKIIDESSIGSETKSNINQEKIFDNDIKESLDNVSIMTTIPDNTGKDSSINLNIEKEKIEIFRENKREYSNDSTFVEIIDYIRNKKKYKKNFNNVSNNNMNIMKNLIKRELLRNKSKMIKNHLSYNKKSCESNKNKNNILNIIKKKNKKKIPFNKINVLLKKIKTNNIGKNVNRIELNENIVKSLDNLNKKIEPLSVKNSNLNNKEKQNKSKKSNGKKISGFINDYQNKENLNNNNNHKTFKKINKAINNLISSKDNKILNQKIILKKKKKRSRNKNSFYQSIQSMSSFYQNTDKNIINKNKRISLHKTFAKNQPSNNKTISTNNNDTLKTIIPSTKINHLRHKTKFIKYQNVEKIFKNIYSKIKKQNLNKNNFNSIHINNNHNNFKQNIFKSLIIDNYNNHMNTINYNNSNPPNNFLINSSISNIYSRKSFKYSMNNLGSFKILQRINNSKKKNTINKNITRRYNTNVEQNSLNTFQINKSNYLNKTYESNCIQNNLINNNSYSLKKSYKSLSKNKKNICNKKLKKLEYNRMKNIKSINSYSINNNGKIQIISDENLFKNFKKINSFNKRKNGKNQKLDDIINNNKKEIKINKKILFKIAKNFCEKNRDKNSITLGNIESNRNNNSNLNRNSNTFKNREQKIRNLYIKNRNIKANINNSKYNIHHSIYNSIKETYGNNISIFHNKSLSTYGLDINSKKYMKLKM